MRYQGCTRRKRQAFAAEAGVDQRTIDRLLEGGMAWREEAYRAARVLRAHGYEVKVKDGIFSEDDAA